MESNDFKVLNLEAPLTNSSKKLMKTGPCLKIAPVWSERLREFGVNVVTLANNHIMDYSKEGFTDTLHELSNAGIAYVGGGTDLKDAGKPLYLEHDGIRIAILNFADREFSCAGLSTPGANPIDVISNVRAIKSVREQSDQLIIIVHGGHEYLRPPGIYYRDLLRFYAENGASMVISHHTHVASGYEIYRGIPIFYSLGNFFFPWNSSKPDSWFTGIGVQVVIQKERLDFEVVPTCFERSGDLVDLMDNEQAEQVKTELEDFGRKVANDKWLMDWWDLYYQKNSLDKLLAFYKPNRIARAMIRRSIYANKRFLSKSRLLRLFHLLNCESRSEHVKSALQHIMSVEWPE